MSTVSLRWQIYVLLKRNT